MTIPSPLPPRLHRGRVIRIHNITCLEAKLSLGFGVDLTKNLVLEGIDARTIPASRRRDANHCLVVIAGGRDILAYASDDQRVDGFILARVYLDMVVPPGLDLPTSVPPGLSSPLVDVADLYTWAATTGFNAEQVRSRLKVLR